MNSKHIGILSLIIFGMVASGCSSEGDSKAKNSLNTFGKSGDNTPVTGYVVRLEKQNNRIVSSGTLIANEEVDLKSEISGKLTHIYFTEGTSVSKNQLLAKMNDADLQAQLTKAVSQRKLADEKEVRQRQLLDKNAISQQEYDISLNELNTFQAEENLIKAQIQKSEIRAPFEGQIGLKYVSEGSYISPATTIATLVDLTPLKIDFSIPERYVNQVKKGMEIEFTVQGTSDKLKAQVYAIEPRINAVSRTVQLRALYPNLTHKILPGAFAEIELKLSDTMMGIAVPSESIVPELNGQKVFLYRGGVVSSVKVETGLRSTTQLQITKGLSVGDTVITSGLLQIRNGSRVRLTELK